MAENLLHAASIASREGRSQPSTHRNFSRACSDGNFVPPEVQRTSAARAAQPRSEIMPVTPTALVVTTAKWFPTARLGVALHRAGFRVECMCPAKHPITTTRSVARTYFYDGLAPVSSLRRAIQAGRPDLVVSGDDFATRHLYELYDEEKSAGDSGRSICDLIERSLGSAAGFPVVTSRVALMALAEQEGIRIAATAAVPDRATLRKWIGERGLPVVLKADGSSSGEGVQVADTLRQADRAFDALQSPLSFVRMAKRALINKDLRWVRPTLERRRSVISAQEFISGVDATSLVACWKGEVVAGLHFKVMSKQYARGPASVLRLIENAEMADAIRKIVRRLSLSGLHGFDFLLAGSRETAYLIEMNPRATQVGHLALGPGCDLPAALYSVLTGQAIQEAPRVTDCSTIALFPQEWLRKPAKTLAASTYHDIPWEEPELMQACLRTIGVTLPGGEGMAPPLIFSDLALPNDKD